MSPFQKWLLLGSAAATGLTGVVYWWMDAMLEPVNEWAVINHPLQPHVLKAHILVAPVLVFAVGLIFTDHVWRHFRLSVKKRRRSGIAALATFPLMVLSGYAIQVFTSEAVLTWVGWVHVGVSVVFLTGLAVHEVLGGRVTSGTSREATEPAPEGRRTRSTARGREGRHSRCGSTGES